MSDGLNDLPLWSDPVEEGPLPWLVPDLPPVRATAPAATRPMVSRAEDRPPPLWSRTPYLVS